VIAYWPEKLPKPWDPYSTLDPSSPYYRMKP
jgi:hypothetical protein